MAPKQAVYDNARPELQGSRAREYNLKGFDAIGLCAHERMIPFFRALSLAARVKGALSNGCKPRPADQSSQKATWAGMEGTDRLKPSV